MTQNEQQVLEGIAQKVAIKLVKMYEKRSQPATGLIFPRYRALKKDAPVYRISEQEARLAFAIELDAAIRRECCFKYYSIETPTKGRYSGFAKKHPDTEPRYHDPGSDDGRSGSIDLSIYRSANELPDINIEFKQGTSTLHDYKKDFLKLCSEPRDGVWFHVFEGNAKTLATINRNIKEAIHFVRKGYPKLKKPILVIIVSLDPAKSESDLVECDIV